MISYTNIYAVFLTYVYFTFMIKNINSYIIYIISVIFLERKPILLISPVFIGYRRLRKSRVVHTEYKVFVEGILIKLMSKTMLKHWWFRFQLMIHSKE